MYIFLFRFLSFKFGIFLQLALILIVKKNLDMHVSTNPYVISPNIVVQLVTMEKDTSDGKTVVG